MSKNKFTYSFYGFPGQEPKPHLPIRFVNPDTGESFKWLCLCDTGADNCMLTATITELTGHNLKGTGVKSAVTTGISNIPVTTWLHSFKLQLVHPTESSKIVWESDRVQLECSEHIDFPILLGQKEFLSNFKITFNYLDQTVTVEW